MDRVILHCDLNNFYASVECMNNPQWANVPLAVAGNPEKRHGVVLAKNELAKAKGVKTGDVIWEAKLKCPNIIVVPPHMDEYMKYSRLMQQLYLEFTSQVEPFGGDECWLDVTASVQLLGSGEEMADKIRSLIKSRYNLSASVGVSFNKIFAKIGSDLRKPDATSLITRDNFREKIFHLPASDMLGVGRKMQIHLARLNILTIGDLAGYDKKIMNYYFGIVGERLVDNARGLNTEHVREYTNPRKPDSVGHGMTALRDLTVVGECESLICYLADKVATRLRRYGYKCNAVSLSIRDKALHTTSMQSRLSVATSNASEISEGCMNLLRKLWDSTPLRSITISAYALDDTNCNEQISMWTADTVKHNKLERLDKTLDSIRGKYGHGAITRSNLIATDYIYDKSDDEDFLPFQR